MGEGLTGIDISHHNKYMKDPTQIKNFDFVIMKASEGISFKDSMFDKYNEILSESMTIRGAYHYARPDCGNMPIAEAKNFIEKVWPYIKNENMFLALDVEGAALKVPQLDGWCYQFCKYVFKVTGIMPLIYTSAAYTHLFEKCVILGCGLWVAKWGAKPKPSDLLPWHFWAIWQYTSKGYVSGVRTDFNYFNGTVDQLLKYCEVAANGKENNTSDISGD